MTAALIMFATMIALIIIGFDVALAMIAASIVYVVIIHFAEGLDLSSIIPQLMGDGMNAELLFAVPLFVLMGSLMHASGITETLMRALLKLLGRLPGPLGYVNVLANVVMSGMSGSAIADAAATSSILVRPMIRTGYDPAQAGALTAAAATIGPIIPPSIPFVLIGGLAGVSIGQLFVAGILPGLLVALVLVGWVALKARHLPRVSVDEVFPRRSGPFLSFLQLLFAVFLPVLVVGSMITGAATVTESAAIGCALALIGLFTLFNVRDLSVVYRALVGSATSVGAILITVAASAPIGWILAREGIGTHVGDFLQAMSGTPVLMWFVTVTALLILGLALEPIPLILILTPIVYPQLAGMGVDPVHFSVVMTVALMIGLISPPVGISLFTVSQASGVPLKPLLRASWPFVGLLGVAAYVVALVPWLSLWLPSLFF
jgi:tripartite ATP-independent transporter DctM subunit